MAKIASLEDPQTDLEDLFGLLTDYQYDIPELELDIDSSFHQLEPSATCETWNILSEDFIELDQEFDSCLMIDFSFGSSFKTQEEKDQMGGASDAVYTNVDRVLPEPSGEKTPDSISTSRDCVESVDDLSLLLTSSSSWDVPGCPPAASAEPTLPQDTPSTSGMKGGTPEKGEDSQRQRRRPKVSYRNMTKEQKTSRVRLLNNEASKLYRDRRKDKRTRLVQEAEELEKANEALRLKVRRMQEQKEKLRKCAFCRLSCE